MREYMRVTRPGGYVGITEMTWLAPPPPQATDYYQKTVYADVLQAEGWAQLLRDAGLKEVVANAYKLDIPLEARNRIKRYGGCRGMLQMLVNVVIALCQDPNSWAFLQDVVNDIPKDLIASTGYGVYVGRKT